MIPNTLELYQLLTGLPRAHTSTLLKQYRIMLKENETKACQHPKKNFEHIPEGNLRKWSEHLPKLVVLKTKSCHTKYSPLIDLIPFMFAQFSKSLRVFPIFLATNKEMKGDLSLLHSTVKRYRVWATCRLNWWFSVRQSLLLSLWFLTNYAFGGFMGNPPICFICYSDRKSQW